MSHGRDVLDDSGMAGVSLSDLLGGRSRVEEWVRASVAASSKPRHLRSSCDAHRGWPVRECVAIMERSIETGLEDSGPGWT